MTTTIFGKKLLMIATITVMLSGLMLVTTFDDAEAKKDKTGEHKLKCKSNGSFFPPSPAGVFSSSEGKCSAGLNHMSSASVSSVVPSSTTPGCLTLTSIGDDFLVGKKEFVMLTSTGEQCFYDENGAPTLPVPGTFCTTGGPHTSTVTGTYAISSGLVQDTPVIGGSGDFVSEANHCDDDAPYRNSFTTKLEGTIVFP